MPDKEAPVNLIQNSLAAGEVAPTLYGRTDLAKLHQGAAIMRNFFVDYKGGASTRPGTQFIGFPSSNTYTRLIPFQFSSVVGQTYMLVFSQTKIRFIKNSGGNSYPNSSNSGFIMSGGVPYEVTTPYLAADLPFIKVMQVGDQLYITRTGYNRKILSRITDTNWTFTEPSLTTSLAAPTITAINISGLPAGSTDPQKTRYSYAITAVDETGQESLPSAYFISGAGIDIGATQGTVSVFWTPVAGAAFYKVYKALPTPGDVIPTPAEQYGFCGYSYGTTFNDGNIVPDFTKAPLRQRNPFAPSPITGYAISASSNDWPVVGTTVTITDATGTGAVIYPILDVTAVGAVGHIVGLYIANPGSGYTAPTIAAAGGGTTFTATLSIGPSTGITPDVVSLFQQRYVFASTDNKPNTIFGSRIAHQSDFRTTNPTVDNDAFEFDIASPQINRILWMQSMPGGLVIATNSGIVQLTAGSSSAANPSAVTPSSAVIVPQSYFGAADIHPIVINYDILYVRSEGSGINDLQYNFFVNIYTGTDISQLSSHLFYPNTIVDWAYQDTPKKVIWAVRSDGVLLSLTYLKEQEILGWARHDTNGLVESVGVVQEGNVDAVYLSVNRGGQRCIERLCDRIYHQIDDAWCLDSALSTQSTYPNASITGIPLTGTITMTASDTIFGPVDVGKVIRWQNFKGTIIQLLALDKVVVQSDPNYGPWSSQVVTSGNWRKDTMVSSLSGLAHLNGFQVYALVDGVPQGPFTVNGGTINLSTPGSQVVVGIKFTAQLQTLYLDTGGEVTMQGKRKKVTAANIRCAYTAGLEYGLRFDELEPWRGGVSSTDPNQYWPGLFPAGAGLTFGDQRLIMPQDFNVVGSVCIQQDQPLPATILAIIAEVAQGDTA